MEGPAYHTNIGVRIACIDGSQKAIKLVGQKLAAGSGVLMRLFAGDHFRSLRHYIASATWNKHGAGR